MSWMTVDEAATRMGVSARALSKVTNRYRIDRVWLPDARPAAHEWVTREHAAGMLGVSERTIRNWLRSGRVTVRVIASPSGVLYSVGDLHELEAVCASYSQFSRGA